MYIKPFTLALAFLAGASAVAVPAPVANDAALVARHPVEAKIRATVEKRQFGCWTDTEAPYHEFCIYCMVFGYDNCCTKTDMTTGQTLDDGCDYFGKS